MKRFCLIACFILTFLVSCASTKAVLKANFEGLPAWYTMPQSSTGSKKYSFVGKGEGDTERQAELRATVQLYSNICNALGQEEDDEQYRELTLSRKIEKYKLKITNKDVSKDDGVYTVYLRAKGSKSLLEENLSSKIILMREELAEIESLVLAGDELIKVDNDISAAGKYIKSLCLSYNNLEVDQEYSFDEILNECKSILSSIEITLSEKNESKASCTVTVTRNDRGFGTRSIGCPVIAKYTAVGVDGKEYEDSFTFFTDENGSFEFSPINYSMLQNGTVTFCLGIEQELNRLEKIADTDSVRELETVFESVSKNFDYSLVYTNQTVCLAVVDFDYYGDNSSYYTADYFNAKFKSAGIKTMTIEIDAQTEDSEIIHRAESLPVSYLFVSRIQIADTIKSVFGEYTVSCQGSFFVYDLNKNKILWESELINSTGFGQTKEEAERNAFYNLADLFFSLTRSVYV